MRVRAGSPGCPAAGAGRLEAAGAPRPRPSAQHVKTNVKNFPWELPLPTTNSNYDGGIRVVYPPRRATASRPAELGQTPRPSCLPGCRESRRPTSARPTDRRPAGSQPVVRISAFAAGRPMANRVGRLEALGVGNVERGHLFGANSGQIAGVAAVIAADDHHQVDRLLLQERDHRVLPILGGAADGVERPETGGERVRRRTGRASPGETTPAPPAIPTSASSSGWPGRRAARSRSGSKPGDIASRNRARNARDRRRDGCSRTPRWSRRYSGRRESGRWRR